MLNPVECFVLACLLPKAMQIRRIGQITETVDQTDRT